MNWVFDRSEYRIPYPPSARPSLTVGGEEREVVDCSENGLRYVGVAGAYPEAGATIEGTLRLVSGGPSLEVCGKVVRVQKGEVALHLERPIPIQRIFQEQRYLVRHFPARRV